MRAIRAFEPMIAVAALLMFAGAAAAYEEKPYEAASFKAAQAEGKPILVDVYAPWCPTCAAQKQVLAGLQGKAAYDKLVIFRVDYDNDAAALKAFNARQQSTLIAYKGEAETGRSVGDTQAASIEALIGTALK